MNKESKSELNLLKKKPLNNEGVTEPDVLKRKPTIKESKTELQFQRFTRLNRTLHVLMIISFLTLALTGLSLKFSYTGWAVVLSHFFGGFESAGYLHRFAAVIMIGVFLTHLIDVTRLKRKEFSK